MQDVMNEPNRKTDCDIFADILVKCAQTQDLNVKLKCKKIRDILETSIFDTFVKCKFKDV